MSNANCLSPVRRCVGGERPGLAGQRASVGAWVAMSLGIWLLMCAAFGPAAAAQNPDGQTISTPQQEPRSTPVPPRVLEAERFLAERGWAPGHHLPVRLSATRRASVATIAAQSAGGTALANTWQPLGPTAVQTPDYGLVTGRVAALALDPTDTTGNRLYLGTTGGGVWFANNAAVTTPSSIVFTPLTDSVAALSDVTDSSISIGALTVQPGETGVILAGTGDPNDVLDSYYGAGLLRSTDGGNTWSLIPQTVDLEQGLSPIDSSFVGAGFAGFAWSTTNPQFVVAAVSQAYEGTLVNADWPPNMIEGLFYSMDSGATWHLATITDGPGEVLQGPLGPVGAPGFATTAVVWNPVRQMFVAAVRDHGYYQSPDGITWTLLASQPVTGFTTETCADFSGQIGTIACAVYRGELAVNPETGDTFAWTVDLNNQDQGLWQDQCAISNGACGNPTLTFAKQWNTAALETSALQGAVTIPDGDYNLALAAVPSQQDTLVLAGANDLWKCSVAEGCVWRNTTNSTTCMSAQVAEYQHALAWNAANPLEIFLGNDSGLWRSTDAIGETGSPCAATDSSHFQNLNGGVGSLAEVVSLPPVVASPYNLMAGLGVNGTAGVKSSAATADWPQILSGYGGPVAIDPGNSANWYVNNQFGVAIYRCSQTAPCTPSSFGMSPVVTNADVGGDGDAMPTPAPFMVDPLDTSQLLIGTCRVWRGPANGAGWGASNAISPVLDSGATGVSCNGDALIRSMAAMPLASGSEIVYVGMYGAATYGANLPGHVLSATIDPTSSATPVWNDLTLNPVVGDSHALNYYNFDISSVTIDTHDATGNTVYVTVEGTESPLEDVQVVYRSINGGATWSSIAANLPAAPASSLAIDPQNANTVYIATDQGVYFTTQVANCAQLLSNCWSVFGSGLPGAPAVGLSTTSGSSPSQVLLAATYGRGIWQTALWSAGTGLTTASASPSPLAFPSQVFNTSSSPMTVTLANTGSLALSPTSIAITGNFSEMDNCVTATVAVGASCAIQVTFTPQATGPLSGEMTIYANVYGGQLTVDLTGIGAPAGAVSLTPGTVAFGQVEVGVTSLPLPITAANNGASAIPISSVSVTPPFVLFSNSCGTTSLAPDSDCQLEVEFAPTLAGPVSGLLTFTDGAGSQTVELSGTGESPPADVLNPASLAFPATPVGQLSAALPVTITNSGGLPLTSISISASGQFQESSTCGTQLAAGAVCTINVIFAPVQAGAITGTLTVADALHTQPVALSGTGFAPPILSVNPTSLTFTNQQPGVPSPPQTVTVSNTGGSPMANIGFSITGAAASNYSIAATTCGALLANGSSCTVQIVFTPGTTGVIAATLAVSSSTSGVAPVSVPLNGSGLLTAGLTASPAQITFPMVAVSLTSTAQPVTVTNSSGYTISSVTLAAPAPFSVTQNTCTGALAAGANCTAAVVFQPSAPGFASGALTVTSSSVAAPATVALSGTGFDFTVAITGSASQTVVSGQQASYTLVITPAGSAGTFAFSCGTLPTNALCLFNPTTQTLNAGVQGNVLVEISTANASTSGLQKPDGVRPSAGRLALLPLACGLLLIPLAICRRRKLFLLLLLFAIVSCGISSCVSSGGGKGGGGKGGGSSTPTGTYTIPVSVMSLGLTQSVNVTLTVD
jgi:Abnormal spindle-like microcephaly-assoc'd, ASPM-SPD-2-Hydin